MLKYIQALQSVKPLNPQKEDALMRRLAKKFRDIWAVAEQRNKQESNRFHQIYETRKGFTEMGIYDYKTKKFVMFNTINLVGNFKYDGVDFPLEFSEMESLVLS